MTHECELEARSYECDAYGHVNNAVYLNYLEVARHEFMRHAGIRFDMGQEPFFERRVDGCQAGQHPIALTDAVQCCRHRLLIREP